MRADLVVVGAGLYGLTVAERCASELGPAFAHGVATCMMNAGLVRYRDGYLERAATCTTAASRTDRGRGRAGEAAGVAAGDRRVLPTAGYRRDHRPGLPHA